MVKSNCKVACFGEMLGDRSPDYKLFYEKELYKSWILIAVSSKSVEKWGSCGRSNISKWTVMEAAILLICFVTSYSLIKYA